MKRKPQMIVLQGPPCSGKTTWAKEYMETVDLCDTILVSRDMIRESRETYWIPEQEEWVSDVEEAQVRSALKHKFDVIIDDTNLNPKTLQRWQEIADETGAEMKVIEFYVTMDVALKRDNNKDRKHHVGPTAIKRFYKQYYSDRMLQESRRTVNHKIYEDSRGNKCVLCDLDGTLAWMQNRGPFEYDKVGDDKSDIRLVRLLQTLYSTGVKLIFVSGRENTGDCEKDTRDWLERAGFTDYTLYMRRYKDYRPDEIVKKEIFEKYIKDRFDVLCVFDDRDKVVNMWRNDIGLLTCQVNEGNF